jgi:hypothetical protein
MMTITEMIAISRRKMMIKRDKENEDLFREAKEEFFVTEHYEDCPQQDSPAPINECQCWCYEMQIFKLGREAQEKNDDGSSR